MGLKEGGLRGSLRNVSVEIEAAIPDSEDLHARWSAKGLELSDQDSVNSWEDETGNGHDLTAGSAPTFITDGINGNPAVRFDGTNNYLDVAFSALSQPNNIYAVFRYRSINNDNDTLYDAEADPSDRNLFNQPSNDDFRIFAGEALDGGNADTNPHISSALFNGSSSTHRIDGAEVASGDAGTESLDGFTVGANRGDANNAPIDIGEILIYPEDKSGIQSDVEQYLSSEWAISL